MSPLSRKLFPAVLSVALALLILAIAVSAQSDSGRIRGLIKDQNGALVPGATVTVTFMPTTAAHVRGLRSLSMIDPWGSAALHPRLYAATRFAG